NDHPLLAMCGLAVAVANALPSLKREADIVTTGACGDGIIELAGMLVAGVLPHRETAPQSSRHLATQ
ncbi:MAG: HAD hydrolase family protein, partial [Acidobacteriaceae bacterium]|nr:HAD hydrolase family protein [Acidobacteriaceae bacterium]